MKHLLAILLCAFASVGIGIAIVKWPLSNWIETFIHGDDDINSVVRVLLFVFPALFILGGWIGSTLFRKYRSAKER
jgi:fucose permease